MSDAVQSDMWTEPIQVQYGDVWQLGRHRIACMDAFDLATYDVLLQGMKPDCILTDPPYGIRLDTDYSSMRASHTFNSQKGVNGGVTYLPVAGDHKDFDASLLYRHFSRIREQFWFGANYYALTLGDTEHGGSWLVWDKRTAKNFDKMFGSSFELVWSKQKHKQDILRHRWCGVFGSEHEIEKHRQHPTQKPLPLIEDILTRYTKLHYIILDMFLGSGTTIVASERMGRTAYGCELSPDYCQIAIQRWQALTGQRAHRISIQQEDVA